MRERISEILNGNIQIGLRHSSDGWNIMYQSYGSSVSLIFNARGSITGKTKTSVTQQKYSLPAQQNIFSNRSSVFWVYTLQIKI